MANCESHNSPIKWNCCECNSSMCSLCKPVALQGLIYCSSCISKRERSTANEQLRRQRNALFTRNLKILAIIIGSLLLIFLTSRGCQATVDRYMQMHYSKDRAHAHEFTAKDLSGQDWSIGDLRGKVVLLDFWAGWCPSCVLSIPSLKKLYAAENAKGLVILGINLDENADNITKILNRYRPEWPQIPDAINYSKTISSAYRVRALPFYVLIDKQGRIFLSGHIPMSMLTKYVRFLLEQPE